MSQHNAQPHRQTRHITAPTNLEARGFLGSLEQTLRVTARIEKISGSRYGIKTYVMHDDRTGNVLEWSSARRYQIIEGDELRLSGVVSAHLHRNGVPVTRLRNCFNPMRVG